VTLVRLVYVAVWSPLLAIATVGAGLAVVGFVLPGGFFGAPSLAFVIGAVGLVAWGWTMTLLLAPHLGFDPDDEDVRA
jgi:hypothetical protein